MPIAASGREGLYHGDDGRLRGGGFPASRNGEEVENERCKAMRVRWSSAERCSLRILSVQMLASSVVVIAVVMADFVNKQRKGDEAR